MKRKDSGTTLSVALVGARRVNAALAELLLNDDDVEKLVLCCMNYETASKIVKGRKALIVDEDKLYASAPEVVVEDIGAERAMDVVMKSLEAGAHVVVMSASVFSDERALNEAQRKAMEVKRNVVIPFGALPAMDALEALSLDGLKEIEISVRRTPEQLLTPLKEAGIEPEAASIPIVVYEGSVLEELRRVKEDINTLMAAVLAAKRDATVKIIADSNVRKSEYKITMKSDIGTIEVTASYDVLLETHVSKIMIYSAYRAVKRLLHPWGVKVL